MTAETKIIPADVAAQLDADRYKLRLAKQMGSPAWEASILQHIDELLDQIGDAGGGDT